MDLGVEWPILWRSLNIIFGLLTIGLLVRQMFRYWEKMYLRTRLVSLSLVALLSEAVVGAWENMRAGNEIGWRVVLASAAIAWTLWAVIATKPSVFVDKEDDPDPYE